MALGTTCLAGKNIPCPEFPGSGGATPLPCKSRKCFTVADKVADRAMRTPACQPGEYPPAKSWLAPHRTCARFQLWSRCPDHARLPCHRVRDTRRKSIQMSAGQPEELPVSMIVLFPNFGESAAPTDQPCPDAEERRDNRFSPCRMRAHVPEETLRPPTPTRPCTMG